MPNHRINPPRISHPNRNTSKRRSWISQNRFLSSRGIHELNNDVITSISKHTSTSGHSICRKSSRKSTRVDSNVYRTISSDKQITVRLKFRSSINDCCHKVFGSCLRIAERMCPYSFEAYVHDTDADGYLMLKCFNIVCSRSVTDSGILTNGKFTKFCVRFSDFDSINDSRLSRSSCNACGDCIGVCMGCDIIDKGVAFIFSLMPDPLGPTYNFRMDVFMTDFIGVLNCRGVAAISLPIVALNRFQQSCVLLLLDNFAYCCPNL